jgi:nucleoside phosphorylase
MAGELSAKRANIGRYLKSLPSAELVRLTYDLGTVRQWWIGEPTEERIQNLRKSIPRLEEMIDFGVVFQRLAQLDSFERTEVGIGLKVFFPELIDIHTESDKLVRKLPQGIEKAEWYLRAIADDCGADSDVEAAVYFASRGKNSAIDADEVRSRWHSALCSDIKSAGKKVPRDVVARAQAGTISLSEASEILIGGFQDRFFSFRDEEDDFIDATFFRAVEWLEINGFEPWLRSLIEPLSLGPKYGAGEGAGWWLFFFCRSDLALRMAGRHGPEAWLWALVNGELDREAPWRVFWGDKAGRIRDYVPLAGIILFAWRRINPHGLNEDILKRANELLFQTQMRSGAWPLFVDSAEPCLIATCFAIHGIALTRPPGWERAASKGAAWIKSQQGESGLWHIAGGPAVMLTVLALDCLELARGGTSVTFQMFESSNAVAERVPIAPAPPTPVSDPAYDVSGEGWYDPVVPALKSVSYGEASRAGRPKLAIVVATETELRQVLRMLKPLPRQKKLWKVTRTHDTFYLGQFGAFQAVIVLSGMGSQGVTGATLSVKSIIDKWNPLAVLMVGIAFGANRNKQQPGDVLVAEHLIPYEQQRIGETPRFRNPVPPSSEKLLNRFRNVLDWEFTRPDGSLCSRHIGPLLSGEKLVDNKQFKDSLLGQYPNAIGGEMEGTGLWSAAQRAGKDWIIAKGVCDWADGVKHDRYQAMAAAAAVSLSHKVFSDPHVLDGL